MQTTPDFSRERTEAKKRFAEALKDTKAAIEEAAKAETAYRQEEAELLVQAPGLKRGEVTAEDRKIWIEAKSAEKREVRDITAGFVRARFKYLDFLLQDMSMAQTEAGTFKAEAKAAGFEDYQP